MQYNIHATGLTLTPAIKTVALEKFGRLERMLGRVDAASSLHIDIELGRTTHHHHKGKIFRAEVHIPLGKHSVYAAAECEELYAGIDQCVSAAKRQLEKIKEKI